MYEVKPNDVELIFPKEGTPLYTIEDYVAGKKKDSFAYHYFKAMDEFYEEEERKPAIPFFGHNIDFLKREMEKQNSRLREYIEKAMIDFLIKNKQIEQWPDPDSGYITQWTVGYFSRCLKEDMVIDPEGPLHVTEGHINGKFRFFTKEVALHKAEERPIIYQKHSYTPEYTQECREMQVATEHYAPLTMIDTLPQLILSAIPFIYGLIIAFCCINDKITQASMMEFYKSITPGEGEGAMHTFKTVLTYIIYFFTALPMVAVAISGIFERFFGHTAAIVIGVIFIIIGFVLTFMLADKLEVIFETQGSVKRENKKRAAMRQTKEYKDLVLKEEMYVEPGKIIGEKWYKAWFQYLYPQIKIEK